MRHLLFFVCALAGFAADPQTATITGRVFDVYHRPVKATQVVPIERRVERGHVWLVPGIPSAAVDEAGMYRLSLAPGGYLIAVTPPPRALDFATVFPVYFPDTTEPDKAQAIVLRPGEVRPFVDFLLLDTEPHAIAGRVTDAPASWTAPAVAVSLYASSGYAGPLQTVLTDHEGHFQLHQVPAGSYELVAAGPALGLRGLDPVLGNGPRYGHIYVEVSLPEVGGLQIVLQDTVRSLPVLKSPEARR